VGDFLIYLRTGREEMQCLKVPVRLVDEGSVPLVYFLLAI
jgi:hypothetical protein